MATIDSKASWPRLFAGLGWRTAGATFTIGGKFAKFAAFAGLGVAALEATSGALGVGGAMSNLYENTIGAYSREYALTKARLYLSLQMITYTHRLLKITWTSTTGRLGS